MIKNERQYRITKARLEEFEQALAESSSKKATEPEDKLWLKVQGDALTSQLDEFREELRDYEELRNRGLDTVEVNSLGDLPRALLRGRIAAGLTQKELADRLKIKEQQIQRYEATDYAGASLERIQETIDAIGLRFAKGLLLPRGDKTLGDVLRRMKSLGLSNEFVHKRLLPKTLASTLDANIRVGDDETQVWAVETAARLGRVFDWPTDLILSNSQLPLRRDALEGARFKVPARAEQQFFAVYTVYAHYLALVLLQCTSRIKPQAIPTSANAIRDAITVDGRITLYNLLKYSWDHLGIPVLPLNDSGAFHGACWRIKGRSVIVLKQRTNSFARWIIDLLHELRHLSNRPAQEDVAVIEPEVLSKDAPSDVLDEETEATDFAGEVALDGRAEELAEKCVNAAKGRLEWLKTAVPRVARAEHIPVDLLANYMAYRLSLQGENWWGAAQNLQTNDGHPWQMARDFVLSRADFENVNPIDRELLLQALSETE
jgi:ribosome-binding protein aMBF1 (putative translation factor)